MALTTQSAHRKDLRTGYATLEHRHFATIAAIIRALPAGSARVDMAQHFASRLALTNPKFDADRFIRARLGANGEG